MSDHVFYMDAEWYYEWDQTTYPSGWYYWDEIDQLGGGPFDTEEQCRAMLAAYCRSLWES